MDLWDEIRGVAKRMPELAVLPPTAAEAFVDRAAQKFVGDRTYQWWWETLRDPVIRVPYEATEWLPALESRLGGVEQVNLIVTNEEPEAAGVIAGPPGAVLSLIAELPYFEFAVTDPDLAWMIFDTHDNFLVIAGDTTSA